MKCDRCIRGRVPTYTRTVPVRQTGWKLCSWCEGTLVMTAQRREWLRRGIAMDRWRVEHRLTTRQHARQLGVREQEYIGQTCGLREPARGEWDEILEGVTSGN